MDMQRPWGRKELGVFQGETAERRVEGGYGTGWAGAGPHRPSGLRKEPALDSGIKTTPLLRGVRRAGM